MSSTVFIQVLVFFLISSHAASQKLNGLMSESSNNYKHSSWFAKNWRQLVLAVSVVILLIVLFIHAYRLRNSVVIEDMTLAITTMLESFPTQTFSSDEEVGRGDTTMCPVCQGDFTQGETIVSLPVCSHSYHLECIEACWTVSGRALCPYCRHDYMSRQQ